MCLCALASLVGIRVAPAPGKACHSPARPLGQPALLVSPGNSMDSNLAAMWLADAQAICAEAGQTVTINSVSYAAMASDPTLTPSLEQGGLMDKITTLIKVPATTAALAAKSHMQPGKRLTFDARPYRVTAFTYKPGSAWLQMQCQDADQR